MKFHPVSEIFPMMSDDQICELAKDIEKSGLREPIVLHPDDRSIVDGRNRFKACQLAGIDLRTIDWDGVGSLVLFVVSLNLHRRHLNESQRGMVAARIATLEVGQGQTGKFADLPSQAEAARLLSVGERSVRNARKVQREGTPELAEAVDAGQVSVSAASELAKAPHGDQREIVARGKKEILEAAKQIRTTGSLGALQSSESNEYYTPAEYVEAARELMGGIDLDPASCSKANETVGALEIYTAHEDGCLREWSGRVWLNPPYGRGENHESNQGRWSAKLLEEYDVSRITEAVMLVNAVTDRSWFAPLWDHGICFVSKRIKFYTPDGNATSPTHGNVLVYLGPRVKQFVTIFSKFGRCVIPRGEWSEAQP